MSIQGHLLEVTVVECQKLKDTELISRQDPYVVLEYGSTKYRTRTCTDGHKNPKFQEKFVYSLIEGLREINVVVWNSNTLTYDDFIGSGKIQIQDVLSKGYDDRFWTLQTKTGRYAGEIKLIMHYARANQQAGSSTPSAAPYATGPPHHISMYSAPPPPPAAAAVASGPSYTNPSTPYHSAYPPYPTAYSASSPYPSYTSAPPTHHPSYPPPPHHDPASSYPPAHAAYPASAYPPPPAHAAYPYPPPPPVYYPPTYPSGPHAGAYPPPYH